MKKFLVHWQNKQVVEFNHHSFELNHDAVVEMQLFTPNRATSSLMHVLPSTLVKLTVTGMDVLIPFHRIQIIQDRYTFIMKLYFHHHNISKIMFN